MIYSLLHAALERTTRNIEEEMSGNGGRPCTKHHWAGEEDVSLICPKAEVDLMSWNFS